MRAIRTNLTPKGPEGVALEEIAAPELSEHMLTIDVHAAGVSFPDLLLSKGEYQLKPDPPFTMGSEGAGTVANAPAGSGFEVGDRVAFLSLGCWAEQAYAAPQMTFPLPDELSFEQGAALIINYHTALFALRDRGGLAAGETVLVLGAAGGVGTAAIQVGEALGARVIAGVSSDEKAEVALAAGADDVVFTGGEEWHKRVKELTDRRGADVVLDPVGGEGFKTHLRSLAEGGRLLVVGFAAGSIPEVKVNRLLLANTSVVGVAWGAYVASRPELTREIGELVNELAVSGKISPVISEVLNLEDAGTALGLLDERKATGKIVLRIKEEQS